MPESPACALDRARYTEALTPEQRQARLDRVVELNIVPVPLRPMFKATETQTITAIVLTFIETHDNDGRHVWAYYGRFLTGSWHESTPHRRVSNREIITTPYGVDLRLKNLAAGWREGQSLEAFKAMMHPTKAQKNHIEATKPTPKSK